MKKRLLPILILLLLGILFRGWIYRQLVTYELTLTRTVYSATDPKLLHLIDSEAEDHEALEVEGLIELGLSITSQTLHFTFNDNDIDPNRLLASKAAHCVGYASFFAATCNRLLEKNGLSDTWTATPQVGQLLLFNYNVHQLLDHPFFKDHDFVTIENKETGERFTVDPTVNDYLAITFVTAR